MMMSLTVPPPGIIGKDEKVLPMIPGGGTVNDIIME